MNKYALFGLIIFIQVMFSTLAISIGMSADQGSITQPEFGTGLDGLFAILRNLWDFATFSIDNIPFMFVLIFWVLNFIIIFMIADVIKDVIPFT